MTTINIDSAPSSFSISLIANVSSYQAINLGISVREQSGSRFRASFVFANKRGREGEILSTAIDRLMGGLNNFSIKVPHKNYGTANGIPKVVGLTASGSNSINTDGWEANQNKLLLAGDYIQIGSQVFRITEDALSDADGKATLKVIPAVRAPLANDSEIEAKEPKFTMKSTSIKGNDYTMTLGGTAGILYALSLEGVEI